MEPGWPGRADHGRMVQLLMPDGSILQATLRIRAVLTGDCKHIVFEVEDAAGQTRPFVDADQWRFLADSPH
jgi:hypothetical protein